MMNEFELGRQYFYTKKYEDCKTAQMINGWNNEQRMTKNGFIFEPWYQPRNSYSL